MEKVGGLSREIVVESCLEAVAEAAAMRVAREARAAVEARGAFTLVLSGGSTPEGLYRVLAGSAYDDLPWASTHLLWGDERCVSPQDERSNYRLAETTGLLERAVAGVHRMRGEDPPEDAAAAYERVLLTLADGIGGGPELDLILLGMGHDGHTASLFPGSPDVEERDRWVVATAEHSGMRRLTLTMPVFLAARRVMFLVTGSPKRELVQRALHEEDPTMPAGLVVGGARALTWIMDEAAAG
ncbi:MAG: 6-phosphogluconolactonase [Actinobacteria bacterium]|nr:6-phosphogluconolactonase [Actinomycetota bacterium]